MSDISSAVERAKAVAAKLTAAARASGQIATASTGSNSTPIASSSYSSKRRHDDDDDYASKRNQFDRDEYKDIPSSGFKPKHGLGSDDATNSFLAKLGLTGGLVSTKISKEIAIPASMVGLIIGRGGETLKRIQSESGVVKIQFSEEHQNGDPERRTTLIGTEAEVERARAMIMELVEGGNRREMERGGGGGYGPRGTVFPMEVPADRVGLVIGRGGETIKMLQAKSGARITVLQDGPNMRPGTKVVNIQGTDDQIEEAKRMVDDIVTARVMVGGGGGQYSGGGGGYQPPPGQELEEVRVPNDKVGLVIGKGGETVKGIQNTYGVRLQIEQQPDPSGERVIKVSGPNRDGINAAIEVIYEKCGMRGGMGMGSQMGMNSQYGYGTDPYGMMAQQQQQAYGQDYSQYYDQSAYQYDPAAYAAYAAQVAAAGGAAAAATTTAPAETATAPGADSTAAATTGAAGGDDAANAAAWAAYYQYYAQYGAAGTDASATGEAAANVSASEEAPPGA
ncbi:Far upstream element-binding protein 1 [Chytriomyces hyalinus]|nr:Far upstream element-binding protein 1 [Chytriomyces hyalinus]